MYEMLIMSTYLVNQNKWSLKRRLVSLCDNEVRYLCLIPDIVIYDLSGIYADICKQKKQKKERNRSHMSHQ